MNGGLASREYTRNVPVTCHVTPHNQSDAAPDPGMPGRGHALKNGEGKDSPGDPTSHLDPSISPSGEKLPKITQIFPQLFTGEGKKRQIQKTHLFKQAIPYKTFPFFNPNPLSHKLGSMRNLIQIQFICPSVSLRDIKCPIITILSLKSL